MSDILLEAMAMGPYAAYVWSAYAACGVVMIALLIASLRARTRASANLTQMQHDPDSDEA